MSKKGFTFLQEWIRTANPKNIMYIKPSEYDSIFDSIEFIVECVRSPQDIPSNKKYDLIIFDLPILNPGVDDDQFSNSVELKINNKETNIRIHWQNLINALPYLSENGSCLFTSDLSDFYFKSNFEQLLNYHDFYFNALFDLKCPFSCSRVDHLIEDGWSFDPAIVHLTRDNTSKIYADILKSEKNIINSIETYFDKKKIIKSSLFIEKTNFFGFDQISALQKLELMENPYKYSSKSTLKELSNNVLISSKEIEKDPKGCKNSIFVQTNLFSINSISSKVPKNINSHIQFRLKKDVILSDYIIEFFNSEYGKLVLESMTANWRIPKEKIQEQIEKIIIPFPHLNDQKFIISIREKLNSLSETLMDFKSLFSINPNQGKEFYDQLIQMLEVIGKLTLPEKVRQIIREGETKNAEFKQTLSLDVKKQTKEKHLELSALKTVAGFLNASGGNLIIGVDDDRNIIGLNKEINKLHKNLDKFLLHWKNLIKNSIGEEFYPYIDYKIININDKNLLFVECRGSKDPCYLYKKDFYVRTNPATDKLEGPQLVKYIKNHFKS